MSVKQILILCSGIELTFTCLVPWNGHKEWRKYVVKNSSHLSMGHYKNQTLSSSQTTLIHNCFNKRHIRGIREYKKREGKLRQCDRGHIDMDFKTSLRTEPENLTAVDTCICDSLFYLPMLKGSAVADFLELIYCQHCFQAEAIQSSRKLSSWNQILFIYFYCFPHLVVQVVEKIADI